MLLLTGVGQPRRAPVPRPRPVRHPPQDRPPRRVRLRHPLLPRRRPRPPRRARRPRGGARRGSRPGRSTGTTPSRPTPRRCGAGRSCPCSPRGRRGRRTSAVPPCRRASSGRWRSERRPTVAVAAAGPFEHPSAAPRTPQERPLLAGIHTESSGPSLRGASGEPVPPREVAIIGSGEVLARREGFEPPTLRFEA